MWFSFSLVQDLNERCLNQSKKRANVIINGHQTRFCFQIIMVYPYKTITPAGKPGRYLLEPYLKG